ncbi:GAF and HD-GYP domain-containing protein [Desulfatirhabdium butyrativorans]|uniref:GAF and HD-GYP domain-containing protein n=1 Tax=Desulfatirhabdium butyrativorans TaxID=340467 RepID=UPI000426E04F|nr:HD domain-containing phosphohydrolase [Desulfatirhabdium butyrativorans]
MQKPSAAQPVFQSEPGLDQLIETIGAEVRRFVADSHRKTLRLVEIGTALTAERHTGRLLERIVEEACELTGSDGGTLYLVDCAKTHLSFAIVLNRTLGIAMGGSSGRIPWSAVPLFDDDGSPNERNVSAYAALKEQVVNIPDVYQAEGFDFEGTRTYDRQAGYRSKSMLVVPLHDHERELIGVLQLVNALDPATGDAIPFSIENQKICESLASLAGTALIQTRLINDLDKLLQAFIRSIGMAIDEKSTVTSGHVRRVTELTTSIAQALNAETGGVFGPVRFGPDELKELQMAAWLHDLGKITTPNHIMDKSTRLEGIYDRIELIRTRFEVLKRDAEIAFLQVQVQGLDTAAIREAKEKRDQVLSSLQEDIEFLSLCNRKDRLSDADIDRIQTIAQQSFYVDRVQQQVLGPAEIENLSIRAGTLNTAERDIMQHHSEMTYRMLSELPFPKKLKQIPIFAAYHHERIDGMGYPKGVKGDEIPLQARIIALADIFEALTARDRPYKRTIPVAEATEILLQLGRSGHLDPELVAFFIEHRLYEFQTDDMAHIV